LAGAGDVQSVIAVSSRRSPVLPMAPRWSARRITDQRTLHAAQQTRISTMLTDISNGITLYEAAGADESLQERSSETGCAAPKAGGTPDAAPSPLAPSRVDLDGMISIINGPLPAPPLVPGEVPAR
jgi:hypothetical protein